MTHDAYVIDDSNGAGRELTERVWAQRVEMAKADREPIERNWGVFVGQEFYDDLMVDFRDAVTTLMLRPGAGLQHAMAMGSDFVLLVFGLPIRPDKNLMGREIKLRQEITA